MTALDTRSAVPAAPPLTRRGGRTRETLIVWIGLALIALHVLDDSFVQPQPGTSPGDHLVGGLVPLALLGLAAWAYPRLRGGRRGALALFSGVLGIVAGIEAFHYTTTTGASGDDFTGLLTAPAGLTLLGLGVVTLWRTRRVEGNRAWRYARRGLFGLAGLVTFALVLFPIGLGYVTTHTGRAVVPDNHLGVPYEDVTFRTSDGLELEGWYVPSKNGAAVISFPGRSGTQKQARLLARHGYGVLLFDRRGEGRSDGDPNAWGWGGYRDVDAAIRFLADRPDVDPGRIAGIGLSVGGEMMLEATARGADLAAVVSDGAGPRSYAEDMDEDMPSSDKPTATVMNAVKSASIAVFSNTAPPDHLKDLTGRIAPTPLMLIADPDSGHGEELNRDYYAAAKQPKTLWEIPGAGHVGGVTSHAAEYERRVVGFLDRHLAP